MTKKYIDLKGRKKKVNTQEIYYSKFVYGKIWKANQANILIDDRFNMVYKSITDICQFNMGIYECYQQTNYLLTRTNFENNYNKL